MSQIPQIKISQTFSFGHGTSRLYVSLALPKAQVRRAALHFWPHTRNKMGVHYSFLWVTL
jgi:hypothetical protein